MTKLVAAAASWLTASPASTVRVGVSAPSAPASPSAATSASTAPAKAATGRRPVPPAARASAPSEPAEPVVRVAYVDEGPTLKRFRPRAQGRANRILKRTSHITVVVAPRENTKGSAR